MKEKILLSIILPILNGSEDIQDEFIAISEQENIPKGEIEIIIINDGSTDDTLEKIEKYSHILKDYNSIQVFSHKKREGLMTTRIDGAKKAQGKFITFIDKKIRPDKDYLFNFLNKDKNIVIGNVYINKERSTWDRIAYLIRVKIYKPYFAYKFDDVILDKEGYLKFKNKGGGGAMLVRRDYFLKVVEDLSKSIHANDDSKMISKLAEIEPILKTHSARSLYLNRTGFKENIEHLFYRGPKFIDFYMKPGTRFFPYIIILLLFLIINSILIFINFNLYLYEIILILILLILVSIWLSEDIKDFLVSLLLLPIFVLSFSAGIIYGLILKILKKY